MPLDWQILDKQKSGELIDQLTAHADKGLFSKETCGAQYCQLPFYRNFILYRLVNYNMLPVFTMDFLSDGTTFYRLDGSAGPIMLVNSRGAIHLNEGNVMDYLRFFFDNVSTEDGDMVLVDNPDDLPFIDSLDMQQQILLKQRHEKPEVQYNIETDSYVLHSDVFYTGSLLKADIQVDQDGTVSIQERGMIMQDSYAQHTQGYA